MKGWTEEETNNRALMAPCGLYCGTCGIYLATRDGNDKFKAIMGRLFGTEPEETECLGCMQPNPPAKRYIYCESCKIRDCVTSKGFYSCHPCDEWPCSLTESIGNATALRVMNRAIPSWREKVAEHGTEKGSVEWARAECERYHCPECGEPLFRGAQSCRACKKDLADLLDGRA